MPVGGACFDPDVVIWQVDLDDPQWDRFTVVLDPDERRKAERFRASTLQSHFRRCRTALRLLLADYTGRQAAELRFRYGAFGKPELADGNCHFNLSHSCNLALIAVAAHPVGIDLERIDGRSIDVAALGDLVYHSSEQSALARVPQHARPAAFCRLWTQKEAYCKALGVGLHKPLATVRFLPWSSPSVSRVSDEKSNNCPPSFVYNILTINGYSTSVCLPLPYARIRLCQATPGTGPFQHGATTVSPRRVPRGCDSHASDLPHAP